MKHSKISLSIVASALLALSFTGCGGGDDAAPATTSTGTTYAIVEGAGAIDVKERLDANDASATLETTALTVGSTEYVQATALPTRTGTQDTTTLTGTISGTVTLDATIQYEISGLCNVANGGVLNIPAGTVIHGAAGANYILVSRGGKINANGTAGNPVTFTSTAALDGGAAGPGQWGGLTILGYATSNHANSFYEIGAETEATKFGAHGAETANDADNSGTLNHVRILNSGYAVAINQEINGLSLAGIGSGTTISNIYVNNSSDDGIELWGGTVNLSSITIRDAQDDSFDADYGYTGTVTDLTVHGAVKAGMEISSGGTTPMTSPKIVNFTVNTLASSSEGGIYIKDDTTAPTFISGTVNNLGTAGDIHTKVALTDDAKAALAFRDVTGITNFTGAGAADVQTRLQAAIPVQMSETLPTYDGANQVILTGILGSQTLTADKQYELQGRVVVPDTVTLTIDAGTVIHAAAGANYLLVSQGGKIIADGNATNPITFTSTTALNDSAASNAGQWGGVTILGKATSNHTNSFYEIGTEDATTAFGGHDGVGGADAPLNSDDSGKLSYVRILNSGYAVAANQEINGLSLAGVGSTTIINNIYVNKSSDDGIELWGGTVNLTNITIEDARDDSFDADYGYIGTVTNLFVKQITSAHAGFEISSGGDTPMTGLKIIDFTINTVANSDEGGIYLKDDTTAPTFVNGYVNHLGIDGHINAKKVPTVAAKAQMAFKDITMR